MIIKDLSRSDAARELFDEIGTRQVDYLINNAGVGIYGRFVDSDMAAQSGMIDLNIKALMELTHLFVLAMVRRGSGRVLNIASTAAFQPGPNTAAYFTSKSFVLSFTEALAYELRKSGVHITAYCPGPTRTDFLGASVMASTNIVTHQTLPTAVHVAANAYKAMQQGKTVKIHGLKNWLLVNSSRFGPRWMVTAIAVHLLEKLGR